MKDINKYPKEILELLTMEGFNAHIDRVIPDYRILEEAYQIVEDMHRLYFGKPKYSDFVSFKRTRYHYLSKKAKSKKKVT